MRAYASLALWLGLEARSCNQSPSVFRTSVRTFESQELKDSFVIPIYFRYVVSLLNFRFPAMGEDADLISTGGRRVLFFRHSEVKNWRQPLGDSDIYSFRFPQW